MSCNAHWSWLSVYGEVGRTHRRFALALLLLTVPGARADSLDTLDGRSFTGKISTEADAFLVTRGDAATERVPLANLRRATFAGSAEPAPAASAKFEWRGQSVGPIGLRGSFTQSNEVIRITSSGTGKRLADGRFCVWQPLGRQGELTAFVPASAEVAREGQRYHLAGIELLADLGSPGPRVSFVSEHGRSVILQSRTSAGKDRSKHYPISGKGVWLRLARNDLEITASMSLDGEAWKRLETEFIALPDTAFAALSVSGARPDLEITVPITNAQVTRRETQAAPAKPLLHTRSGSALRGEYRGTDGSVVRWAALGREWNVSLVNVGRLVFQPDAASLLKRVRPGRPGALFANGDFVDGELLRSDKTRVTISSVIFGIRSFPVNGEIIAVFVRDPQSGEPKFRVTQQDGGVLLAQDLAVQAEGVMLREPSLGEIQLPLSLLRELSR